MTILMDLEAVGGMFPSLYFKPFLESFGTFENFLAYMNP